ncbi:hypothetical protein [Lactococcus lactis]|uniref:hypothetical protein n=1 Tax=Lactococcus lactis TaxID=1358 RepID=UPI00071CF6CB|nr:hypothetical protein [Lactococcus lactis]KSU23796.1 hypothetical protein LMG14418_0153 [Lactococcus lactis subsp. lactis]MCX7529452.1 hypothetical protein [Lactococcus lactis]MDM7473220.1 hypothetical protein [Lactococcus lactis]
MSNLEKFSKNMDTIIGYTHWRLWAPDLDLVQSEYLRNDLLYSVFTPFMYTYLEFLIRSMTESYGNAPWSDNSEYNKVYHSMNLVKLAINENQDKPELLSELENVKKYFKHSKGLEGGANRNGVSHAVTVARDWSKEDFEQLIEDIAKLSPFSGQ